MKRSHPSFQIPCQEIPLHIKDASHLLKLLNKHLNSSHIWALLRIKSGLILLSTHKILMFSPTSLNQHGKRYLKTEVNADKAGQILLRLSENQKTFNQSMHQALPILPTTKQKFRDYLLAQTKTHEINKTSEIIDQEYYKISLSKQLLLHLLALINVSVTEEQSRGFMHEALVTLEPGNYYPHHLAMLLHHLMLDHHILAPPVDLIEYSLCLLTDHPHCVVLGQLKDDVSDGSQKNLTIRYNFCLEKLAYYFTVGHVLFPVCPSHLTHAQLLLPIN